MIGVPLVKVRDRLHQVHFYQKLRSLKTCLGGGPPLPYLPSVVWLWVFDLQKDRTDSIVWSGRN